MGTRTVGAPATVITRRQMPVTYASNAKQIIQLTRGLCYREIVLHLTAQPTLTGVNNTVANTALGDEWGCIQKIELIANGTVTLFSYAGSDLKSVSRILHGQSPRRSPNLGDGATANPALDSSIRIPFLNPRSANPVDTLLYTGEMSDLRLEVTWGTFTGINTAATAWTTQPVIEVFTREQTIPTDPGSGAALLPQYYRRTLKLPVQISGTNSAARYQLNTGPIYRGLIINELNATPAESHSILSNVKVYSGPTTFIDVTRNTLYDWGNYRARIPYEQYQPSAGGFYQASGQVSSVADPLSWLWMDFTEDGYMTEALNTDSLGDTFVEFNVNAACTLNLFTQELLPIKRAA